MTCDTYTTAEEYAAACAVLAEAIPEYIGDSAWALLLARATMDMIAAALPDCPEEILAAREALPAVLP